VCKGMGLHACSGTYPAYCHLRPLWLHQILQHYLIYSTIFSLNKVYNAILLSTSITDSDISSNKQVQALLCQDYLYKKCHDIARSVSFLIISMCMLKEIQTLTCNRTYKIKSSMTVYTVFMKCGSNHYSKKMCPSFSPGSLDDNISCM
jgi:hypothetical protein